MNIFKNSKKCIKANAGLALVFCLFCVLVIFLIWPSVNNNNIEEGDFAANSLLVQDAKHFTLLKGNYSRMGFNHPGPAILYCLAFGEIIFYDCLHVVKSPFSGQLIAVAMYIAFWLVLMLRIIKRYNSSFTASLFFVALFMTLTRTVPFVAAQNFYTYIWFPLLYFFPFSTFITATSRLAIGKLDSLGTMAISAGFLIHGHASFMAIVPIIVLVVLAFNFLSNLIFEEKHLITFKRLLENKEKILLAFCIIFIFLLPIIILTIKEYPGPLAQYYHFSKLHTANALKGAWRFVAFYWGENVGMLWGSFSLAIVLFTIRWWKSVELLWGVVSVIIASTAALLYYAIKGVDMLNEVYIGFFYFSTPTLFITVIVYILITSISFIKKPGLYLLSAISLFIFAKHSFDTAPAPKYNAPQVKALYDSLNNIKLKEERIVITPNDFGDWEIFVSLANYAKRNKNSLFCISKTRWHLLYTDTLKCTTDEEENNKLQYIAQRNPPPAVQKPLKIADFYFQSITGEFNLTPKNMTTPMGHLISGNNKDYWLSEEDREGWVWFGPHMLLAGGNYDVCFNVSVKPLRGNKIDKPVKLDICKDAGATILTELLVQPSDYNKDQFVLSLSLGDITGGLEFRIYKFANTIVEVRDIIIRRH